MRKNRLFAIMSAICFLLSGCSGGSDGEVSDSNPNNSLESNDIQKGTETLSDEAQELGGETPDLAELPYEWIIEPTIKADDIIVSDIELSDEEKYDNYIAAEEAAIIKKDGKYGIISYDGSYFVEPEYTDYRSLDAMYASQLLEVYNGLDKSVQVFNGEYELSVQYDAPYGFGYMSYSYYAVDEIPDVISVWEGTAYTDDAAQGEFLKDDDSDKRQFAIVQKADGYIDENGTPWIKDNSEENKFGIGGKEGIVVPCEYTGGISPYSDAATVGALEKDGKWGYFNSSGEQIIDFICEPTIIPETVTEGDYVSTKIDSASYQIFHAGKGVPYCPTDGFIAVKTEEGCGYYDINGDEVIPVGTFEEARPFHCGKAWVKDPDSGMWGIIQLPGNQIQEETPDVHFLGANFNNLQFGGLVAENNDMVVYLAYNEASVFDTSYSNNQRLMYTGQIWKYDKHSETVSVVYGGEGWDSIWSASLLSYPVENINISEDGAIYLSSYSGDTDSTGIYRINSDMDEVTEITDVLGTIKTMILIDNTLYYAADVGVISYDLTQKKPKIIMKVDENCWDLKLVNFYDNTLYCSYSKNSSEGTITILEGYDLNTGKTEMISSADLSDPDQDQTYWDNVFPVEDGIVALNYDFVLKYSFASKDVKKYDNPYRTLPDSFPPTPYGFIELDNDYFIYTGNTVSYSTSDFHIVKISGDFESAEDFQNVIGIFEASDGSSFTESSFTFGYADNSIWVASDSIVRKYSSDGTCTTLYKE